MDIVLYNNLWLKQLFIGDLVSAMCLSFALIKSERLLKSGVIDVVSILWARIRLFLFYEGRFAGLIDFASVIPEPDLIPGICTRYCRNPLLVY